jgi:hypothetical protein
LEGLIEKITQSKKKKEWEKNWKKKPTINIDRMARSKTNKTFIKELRK